MAAAFLNSGSSPADQLLRSTSSIRYKDGVEDLAKAHADHVLQLRPVWYRSKADADRKNWSWYGLVAEEVAAVDPRLVHWGYLDEDREIVKVDRKRTVQRKREDGSVEVEEIDVSARKCGSRKALNSSRTTVAAFC